VIDNYQTLDRLESQCEAITTNRQQYLHEVGDQINGPGPIPEYLYGGYPVLRETVKTIERIETKRSCTVGARPMEDGEDDPELKEDSMEEPSLRGSV